MIAFNAGRILEPNQWEEPERQRRHLNDVYEKDDEQLQCGFCSL